VIWPKGPGGSEKELRKEWGKGSENHLRERDSLVKVKGNESGVAGL